MKSAVISNFITIFMSLGTGLITLVAIMSTVFNIKLKDQADNIKIFLEAISFKFSTVKICPDNFRNVQYEILTSLRTYQKKYNDFIYLDRKIKSARCYCKTILWSIFVLFTLAFTLNIYLLYCNSISVTCIIVWYLLLFCTVFIFIKNKIANIVDFILPPPYDVDFPTYDELTTPSKKINMPNNKIYPFLPMRLFGLANMFEINQNTTKVETNRKITMKSINIFKFQKALLHVKYTGEDGKWFKFSVNNLNYENLNIGELYNYKFKLKEHNGQLDIQEIIIKLSRETQIAYVRDKTTNTNIFVYAADGPVSDESCVLPNFQCISEEETFNEAEFWS